MIVFLGIAVLSCVTLGIGSLLIFPVFIIALIVEIMATVATSKGEVYRYPACIRLVA